MFFMGALGDNHEHWQPRQVCKAAAYITLGLMGRRHYTATFGIVIAVISAIAFAAFGALEGLIQGRGEPSIGQYIASFACFGFLLGAILAFDPSPEMKSPDRPVLRTLLGALAGMCLGLVWDWSFEGLSLSVLVSAALGYTGMTWAKYV